MATTLRLEATRDEQFEFVLLAADGTELLRGMPCCTKAGARRAATTSLRSLGDPDRVIHHELRGQHFYVVHDQQDDLIAHSPYLPSPRIVRERLDEARAAASQARFAVEPGRGRSERAR